MKLNEKCYALQDVYGALLGKIVYATMSAAQVDLGCMLSQAEMKWKSAEAAKNTDLADQWHAEYQRLKYVKVVPVAVTAVSE